MKINEVEKLTGLSKQNIRFYETKGLINPIRQENDYREYSDEDVDNLKKIILLRKLDFSISEIKEMMDNDSTGNIEEHISVINKKIESYNAIIDVCNDLKDKSFTNLNYEEINNKITEYESKGEKFVSFIDDFKLYMKRDYMREFTFAPDTMCVSKGEMTDALIKYASDHNMELEIIKESTSPDFTLDGIPYNATRYTSRFGAYIICTCTDESYLPKQEMTPSRKFKVIFVYHILPLLAIFLPITITVFTTKDPWWIKLIFFVGEVGLFLCYFTTYGRKFRD